MFGVNINSSLNMCMKDLQAVLCMISNTTKCIKSSRAMDLKFYLSPRLGAYCGGQIGKSL